MFVVALVLASLSYILTVFSVDEINLQQQEKTIISLKKAKQALLAYATIYGDIDSDNDGNSDFPGEYGFFPCPDYNNGLDEGLEDNGSCGSKSISKLGYFPWRTLDMEPLYDGDNTCLFYAVTGAYKNDEAGTPAKYTLLNDDTNGMFQIVNTNGDVIEGGSAEDRVVAVVFAARERLDGQVRSFEEQIRCGRDYDNESAYLEGDGVTDNSVLSDVANSIDTFIEATLRSENEATPYNDRIITITREEIWSAIRSRTDYEEKMTNLTEATALCIAGYGNDTVNGRLPRPALMNLSAAGYENDDSYDDTVVVSHLGRLPLLVDNSDIDMGNYVNSLPPPSTLPNVPSIGADILFDKGFCNALTTSMPLPLGTNVNLETTSASEYYKLWQNWKDHIFYSVSEAYVPSNDATQPSCNGTNCITVNGTEYAAVIMHSGIRFDWQTRNDPVNGDIDTKNDMMNYIEITYPVTDDGTGDFTLAVGSNDIAFCVTDTNPLTVVKCSL